MGWAQARLTASTCVRVHRPILTKSVNTNGEPTWPQPQPLRVCWRVWRGADARIEHGLIKDPGPIARGQTP